MSARKARTEAAAVGAAPVDSEEKDVKIPVAVSYTHLTLPTNSRV